MFDGKLNQRKEYQSQGMKVKQWELYRDDIRDLVELTCSKMDNYLLINTLLIGFCIKVLTEGRPEPGLSPSWLHWLYAVSAAGGLLYFMLSVWLAMHASISAHSFGVRMLTQFVRLPVPSKDQIDAARYYSQDFEDVRASEVLRMPLLRQQMRHLEEAMDRTNRDSPDVAGAPQEGSPEDHIRDRAAQTLKLEHVELFRHVQANWQAYDAYARVCMAMGASQLLLALSYYSIIMFVCENHCTWAALCCALVFAGSGWLILRLDLYLYGRTLALVGLLFGTSPVIAMVLVTITTSSAPYVWRRAADVFVPLMFVIHITWVYFMLHIARPDMGAKTLLPSAFRAVLYLDVYSWVTGPEEGQPSASRQQSLSLVTTEVPKNARRELGRLCNKKQAEVDRDLRLWEAEDVAEQLETNPKMIVRVKVCRERWKRLRETAPVELSERLGDESGTVWLRLYLNQEGGRSVEFYYAHGTGGAQGQDVHLLQQAPSGRPGAEADRGRTSDLEDLEEHIEELAERIAQLKEAHRTGRLLGDSADVAATFDPRAASSTNAAGGGGSGGPDHRARKPPGQLPWRTFRQGSQALIVIWTVGFVWSFCLIFHIELPLKPIPAPEAPEALWKTKWGRRISVSSARGHVKAPELLFSGSGPHTHFNPRGVSCHAAWGPTILIHERYAVHMLRLEADPDVQLWRAAANATFEPALTECLRHAGEFQAEGIISLSLECAAVVGGGGDGDSGHRCHAVLLGAGGRRAALCDLGKAVEPAWLTIHGGPWRALAGGANSSWALAGPTLVQLQARLGGTDQLLPQLEMSKAAANTTQLHALPSGAAVLGLEARGRLNAWFTDGSPQLAWQLPSNVRWAGVCSTDTALYFVGLSRFGGELTIWGSTLPPELAARI